MIYLYQKEYLKRSSDYMLDYIRRQLQPQKSQPTSIKPEDVPDEAILEYAQLFQELDDLSVEGTDAGKERSLGIDIPLEDDLEIETVEFNLNDGRISDVPGDATVVEGYEHVKSYDSFYEEAVEMVHRFTRESDSSYDKRVRQVADKMYAEYCDESTELGLNGFGEINISNDKIPSKANINFGPYMENGDTAFIGRLQVFFATDGDHNITKKQLDSFKLVQEGAFTNIGPSLKAYMESNYDVPEGSNVWDLVSPQRLFVPRGNGDSFCVVLEYANELTGKKEYFGWTRPTNKSDDSGSIENCEKINMESFVNADRYENHATFIQESESIARRERLSRRPLSRFVQEAIDFGGGDDGGDSTDVGSGDVGNDMPPTDDNAADNTGGSDTDVNTDNDTSNYTENNEGGDEDKETAAVNNVSDAIAEKVANQTQADAVDSGDGDTNVTFDDDTSDDSSNGADNEPSVDDQLDDLDSSLGGGYGTDSDADVDASENTEGDEMSDGEDGEIDINNMTIDDLIEQGSEKLKGMTIEQIKNFISSNNPDAVQEAFILTPKNINKEIDVSLRKCLGTLNDNKMNIDKLISKFKLNGRHLNRVLSKAAKMPKAFSTDEIESIKKLNQSLVNLMMSLKKSKDQSQVSTIKTNIAAFTSASKVVAKIVETKLANPKVKVQQEAFLLNNIKDKITNALIPVKSNMEELKKIYDEGNLTRGRIIKRYSAKSTNAYINFGTSAKSANMPGTDHGYSGYAKYAINIDTALKLLNKAIRKKGVDDMELITKLADKLDLISDYIETVIDDHVENKEIIKRIGILSGEIIDTINEFINTGDEAAATTMNNEPTPDTPSVPEDTETTEVSDTDIPDFDDDDTDTSDDKSDEASSDDDTDDTKEGEE